MCLSAPQPPCVHIQQVDVRIPLTVTIEKRCKSIRIKLHLEMFAASLAVFQSHRNQTKNPMSEELAISCAIYSLYPLARPIQCIYYMLHHYAAEKPQIKHIRT